MNGEVRRYKPRQKKELLELTEQLENYWVMEYAYEDDSPALRKKYLHEFIYNVLHSDLLTQRQKEVLELYYFNGLTQREIAIQYNIKPSSVSRCMKLAINKIRKYYVKDFDYGKV